jgi:hypothetical protein
MVIFTVIGIAVVAVLAALGFLAVLGGVLR